MRNNFVGGGAGNVNRVSPGAPRVGVGAARQSPNTRLYGQNKQSVSPGSRLYQKPSPSRPGGISNLGGNANLQRKAPGVKVAPGQTNFLERNRERLALMQERSKERKM